MKVTEEKRCRICRGNLKTVLDLGDITPSGFTEYIPREWDTAPLVLAECEDCKLVQLRHTVDLDLMYRQYWYASSLNKSMVSSLADIVFDVSRRVMLEPQDTVIDIGCNDGTMLEMFPSNLTRIGYDPAVNIARNSGYYFINDYFTSDGYFDTYGHLPAKVITAIAMFYDLPDPHKFVEDVATVLHHDGVFVVQFTDLLSMFQANAFDNICHEHLEYYKLADVKFLLEAHGLEIIDVSYNKVNGGSIRITASHEGRYEVSEEVNLAYEREDKYFKVHGMGYFKRKIEETKTQINNFLSVANNMKLQVFLLGASTKGNTLLQVCNITRQLVPYAAEVNKDKFGLRTAGTGIYIIPEDEALFLKPHFFFVPVWHFKDNLLKNPKIRKYIKEGGNLVFPLPEFEIVGKEDLKDD